MPALPPASRVLRVAMSGSIDAASPWLSRFYVQYASTAPTNAQAATFAGAVRAAYNTNMKSLVHTGTNLQETAVEDLSTSVGATGLDTTVVDGTLAGGTLPAQVAMVVGYPIARRYRGGHPRGYWPMGDDSKVNNPQTWTNAFIGLVQTGVDAFFAAVLAAGWTGSGALTHVSVSYFSGFSVVISPTTGRARNVPVLRGSPQVDTVLSNAPRVALGTQRRRV